MIRDSKYLEDRTVESNFACSNYFSDCETTRGGGLRKGEGIGKTRAENLDSVILKSRGGNI